MVRLCLAPRRIELKSATSMRAGKREARCAASSRYLAHVGRRSVVGASAAAAHLVRVRVRLRVRVRVRAVVGASAAAAHSFS